MDFDDEVSVKDIVNFHIKINNASKAKKALARLSSKDKATAFNIIDISTAQRDFKIEVAKYFISDLDPRVRRKAESMMEALVPGWVSDPGESILALLKSAGGRGSAKRTAAVKFLFGVIDANSLRDTFLTLLNSRNRAHMAEIIGILEEYIDASSDEAEQVKIFDGCLDIVLSDEAEQSVKHHACNLLSVFFKKVATTQLGEILHRKYIERQVEKGEGIHRYLCSGAAGLSAYFLEDLVRPLNEGATTYQLKIVEYFGYILEKTRDPQLVDGVLDTYPDSWSRGESSREETVRHICRRIRQALEELWDATAEREVRQRIIRITYDEYPNKRELLEQIRGRLDDQALADVSREKISQMLCCFLLSGQDEALGLKAARLLLFRLGDPDSRVAALDHLVQRAESGRLEAADGEEVAAMVESLLGDAALSPRLRQLALYLQFLFAPERMTSPPDQEALLGYLAGILEGHGLGYEEAERLVRRSLRTLAGVLTSDELRGRAERLKLRLGESVA